MMQFLATALLVVLAAAPAFPVQTKKKLDRVQERLKQEQSQIQRLIADEGSVLNAMEKVEERVDAEKKALRDVGAQLGEIQKERDELLREVEALEVKVRDTKALLKKRLRAVYRQFREGTLAVLVSTEDYQGLIQRAKYLTYFADRDRKLIDDYRASQDLLNQRRGELAAIEARLEETAAKHRAQKAKYEGEKRKKKALLASIRSDKANYQRMVKELEEAAVRLKELLRAEEEEQRRKQAEAAAERERARQPGKPFAKMKGGLAWPVRGSIASKYGSQRDPEFNTPVFRNGIEIATDEGEKVRAVLHGRVVYADRFKGYGNLVIVDHNDGYHTLYAHLSESAVIPGEDVQAGQVIGLVGESAASGANSLYFEIRHRGKPVDPMPWLARHR